MDAHSIDVFWNAAGIRGIIAARRRSILRTSRPPPPLRVRIVPISSTSNPIAILLFFFLNRWVIQNVALVAISDVVPTAAGCALQAGIVVTVHGGAWHEVGFVWKMKGIDLPRRAVGSSLYSRRGLACWIHPMLADEYREVHLICGQKVRK